MSSPFRIAGVPEHFNLPWHLALESGAFASAGVEVDYQEFPGGTGALTKALREEELDLAIVLTEGMVADIVKGNPSKIIGVYVDSPLIWGIHVPVASSLHKEPDMQGKRYAISRFGSGSHLMAIVDTVQRGWNPDEMDFELIRNLEGARKALPAGEADVFFWEKFMTQPYVDQGEFRRIGEVLTPWPCFMIAAREAVIETREPELKALLQTIFATSETLMQHPNAVEIISDRYDLKPENVAIWFGKTQWNTQLELPIAPFEHTISALHQAQILDTADYPIADLLHPLY